MFSVSPGPAPRLPLHGRDGEAQGLTTNRRRYFVEGVSCRVGHEALSVINLSERGFFASSQHPPRPGEDLSLELLLQPETPLKMHGTVRWINDGASTTDGRLPMGYGVELTDLDAPARSAIRDFLRHSDPVQGPPASW
jgi:PilZ domain